MFLIITMLVLGVGTLLFGGYVGLKGKTKTWVGWGLIGVAILMFFVPLFSGGSTLVDAAPVTGVNQCGCSVGSGVYLRHNPFLGKTTTTVSACGPALAQVATNPKRWSVQGCAN